MLFTLLGTLLFVGSYQIPENAVAVNITTKPTIDNRVKIDSFVYSDSVQCYTLHRKVDPYTFNTEADARAYWNARSPPFETERYYERWKITTKECTIEFNNDVYGFLFVIIAGAVIDVWWSVRIERYLKKRRVQVENQNLPMVLIREPPAQAQEQTPVKLREQWSRIVEEV